MPRNTEEALYIEMIKDIFKPSGKYRLIKQLPVTVKWLRKMKKNLNIRSLVGG